MLMKRRRFLPQDSSTALSQNSRDITTRRHIKKYKKNTKIRNNGRREDIIVNPRKAATSLTLQTSTTTFVTSKYRDINKEKRRRKSLSQNLRSPIISPVERRPFLSRSKLLKNLLLFLLVLFIFSIIIIFIFSRFISLYRICVAYLSRFWFSEVFV